MSLSDKIKERMVSFYKDNKWKINREDWALKTEDVKKFIKDLKEAIDKLAGDKLK